MVFKISNLVLMAAIVGMLAWIAVLLIRIRELARDASKIHNHVAVKFLRMNMAAEEAKDFIIQLFKSENDEFEEY